MEEAIKEIISKYIRIPAADIQPGTVIDRSAVASSIHLHRMFAALSSAGFNFDNYTELTTFGKLIGSTQGSSEAVTLSAGSSSIPDNDDGIDSKVGIDIEEINSMPIAEDFRAHDFYMMNFTSQEIGYCILQKSPYASFAGLFAVKEAIIKADNSLREKTFNKIYIDHLEMGKPIYPGFDISISHSAAYAVAVAIKILNPSPPVENSLPSIAHPAPAGKFGLIAGLLALLISIFALVMVLQR